MIRSGSIVFSENRSQMGLVVRSAEGTASVVWLTDQETIVRGIHDARTNTVEVHLPALIEHGVDLDTLKAV